MNASDIQVSLPVNHTPGDMHLMNIQVDNPPLPVACNMDLEDIRLDVYSADVATSGLSYLEMDLNKASLNVHISDYLIQNLHPQRYLSHLQVPILKPPDLQHQRIWKEARGKLTHLAYLTHPTHPTHPTTTCLLKRPCCK